MKRSKYYIAFSVLGAVSLCVGIWAMACLLRPDMAASSWALCAWLAVEREATKSDIHAVIAELKALEAKGEYTLADQLDMCDAMPRLFAYIDRLEAVVSAAKALAQNYKELADSGDCGNWTCEDDVDEYRVLMGALDALERDE